MVDNMITLQDYTKYWKGCTEKTSSSVSDLHFGHWKAAESSNEVAELHTILTKMEFQSGTPLTWWLKGLQIILQKISGNNRMEK